jgi:hypothetical protein
MAIEIPDDWPEQGWVATPPIAHLDTINEDAPDGTDPTRWKVADWSSTREISSSALPGQVRHKTGLSIGTGRALVKRAENDYPWKKGLVYDLSGQDAQILLAPEGATEIPTGQFRVAEIDGTLTTLGVQVELDEKQIEGAESAPGVVGEQWVSGQQIDDTYFDPIWLVEQLAQQMGYGVGIRPGEELPSGFTYDPVLDVPYQGSLVPEYPKQVDFTEFNLAEGYFGELANEGIVGLTPRPNGNTSAHVEYRLRQSIVPLTTWTMDLTGRARFGWIDPDGNSVAWFRLWNRTDAPASTPGTPEQKVTIQVGSTGASGTSNGSTTANFSFPIAPEERPYGIQVQFEVTAATARARIRRGIGGAWSAWTSNTITNAMNAAGEYGIEVYADNLTTPTPQRSVVSRLSVVDASVNHGGDDALLYGNTQGPRGRIYLEPLGGTSISPWLDPSLSVWATMQAIVSAWQGALITDVFGDLRVLNRFSLTGVGTGSETPIDVGLRFEDIPWAMNYADQADRLVVKYRPAVEKQMDNVVGAKAFVLYEFQDVIIVYPGGNDVFFTLDYVYPVDLKALQFIRKDSDNNIYHVWDAYRYNNGTGAHMAPGTDISMRIDRVTSSTWKVYIYNHTASPFHMVDNSGTPWLKIRSTWYYDQTKETFIERGAAAGDARNALEIDLGHYVQSAEDANALADFIWGRVHQRSWRAATINAVPDYRLDLGDVVELTHTRTGMRSNALVTKVDMAGAPGNLTQKLDLVLIPPTWEDFDEAWAAYQPNPPGSWNEFDSLWDGFLATYTWEDFDRVPTATTFTEIEESM